jgi:hypothetical protein
MCNYQTQRFCCCCKKRLLVNDARNDLPTRSSNCSCNFATIIVILVEPCLTCKDGCDDADECEKVLLPSLIYYAKSKNKVLMYFETDEDESVWNTIWFTRLPTYLDYDD